METNVAAVVDAGDGPRGMGPLFLGGAYDGWPPTGDWDLAGEGLVCCGTLAVAAAGPPVDTTPTAPVRLGEGTPAAMSAAVAVSDPGRRTGLRFGSSDLVVLSRDDDIADALAGLAVAGLDGAPMLLTPGDALAPEVADAVTTLAARRVLVLGGPAAISEAVVEDLEGRGLAVERVGGADRFETAALLSLRLQGRVGTADGGLLPVPTAILASGDTFADAISAGAAAYAGRHPIVLSRRDELPGVTLETLRQLGITQVVVAGGPAAIGPAVADRLRDEGFEVLRLAVPERTGTALTAGGPERIFGAEVGSDWSSLVVANGQEFAEPLVLGAVAGTLGGAAGAGAVAHRQRRAAGRPPGVGHMLTGRSSGPALDQRPPRRVDEGSPGPAR
ncbi:MAG TPA: cell wall-binding repeat-containing protein [Euzebya sp.]|nr:cell wall-binding repeat-containing protein [Euzebya sp.]